MKKKKRFIPHPESWHDVDVVEDVQLDMFGLATSTAVEYNKHREAEDVESEEA